MQDERKEELCRYRMNNAEETLEVAEMLCTGAHYKDSVNRSYYAAFYAVKAVLALEGKDFKRHKDVIGYFNQNYVATEEISKECGRKIAKLQQKREKSDYDDFYVASRDEAEEQLAGAKIIIANIKMYLAEVIK